MGRFGGFVAAATLLTCVAACSSPISEALKWSAPPSTTTPATTPPAAVAPTSPKFTPLVSPAKVTAACPFLGSAEILEMIGTSGDMVTTELAPDPTFRPGTEYQCHYEDKYTHSRDVDLVVIISAFDPVKSVDNAATDCKDAAVALAGAGEKALHCEWQSGFEEVAVAKRSHDQTRLALIYLRKTRADIYETLAKTMGSRL